MNSTGQSKPPWHSTSVSVRRLAISFIVVMFALFFLPLFVWNGEYYLMGVSTLLIGWIPFFGTVIPQVSWNGGAIATAMVCGLGFMIGTHSMGRWWWASRTGTTSWKKGWTLVIAGGVVLLFSASIAVIGVIHQVTWLARTDEPYLHLDRFRDGEMVLGHELADRLKQRTVQQGDWQVDEVIALARAEMRNRGAHNLRLAVLAGPDGKVRLIAFGPYAASKRRAFITCVSVPTLMADGFTEPRKTLVPIESWDDLIRDAERGESLERYFQQAKER